MKKKVLILCQYFFPGYRAGGPQQTIKNVIEEFGNSVDFYLLTSNHDLGKSEKYTDICNGWNDFGKAKIMYLADYEFKGKLIRKYAEDKDIVYCCGLFEISTIYTLIENRRKPLRSQLYIAPMGVFSEGAFQQKYLKKYFFIKLCKMCGLFHDIYWSLTSKSEVYDAKMAIGRIENYVIAEDIPRKNIGVNIQEKNETKILKIVFISRICAKKNLLYSLKILNGEWKKKICFDVYGPIEDKEYWKLCEKEIEKLPINVECQYCGEVEPQYILKSFSQYDIFLFPTLGENFGHVVFEAMSVGCIPVISDTTPWTDLEEYACGKVVSLNDTLGFRKAIYEICEKNAIDLRLMKKRAVSYAADKREYIISKSGYKKIFF